MIWYNVNTSYNESLSAEAEASAILGLLRYRYFHGDEENSGLYLAGFKIRTHRQTAEDSDDNEPADKSKEPVKTSFETVKERIKKTLSFIADEKNRQVIRSVRNVLLKVLKHVFPRDISGSIVFGLDDPYLTGKILELFAILHAGTGDMLKVIPLWDEKKIQWNLEFSGRISIIYMLFQICRLRFNRDLVNLWRDYHDK